MLNYYNGQFKEVADIFYHSIHRISTSIYSQEQLNAWCPSPINYNNWRWRCELKRPYLYVINNQVVSFLELDTNGHIDCLYTHPDYQRQGIAQTLLSHAISVCDSLNTRRMFVEASHLIKPLFEKNGFVVIKLNCVTLRGVKIDNWVMERVIKKL
ncbi:MAG: GNAT family N-acetyltransferase [Microcystaceae cyanobacterium]